MDIVSSANPQLKFARRVRDSREDGLIFVEGIRLVRECLSSNLKLHAAFHLSDQNPVEPDILLELKARKCQIHETSRSAFTSITDTATSQGILLIASQPSWTIEDVFRSEGLEDREIGRSGDRHDLGAPAFRSYDLPISRSSVLLVVVMDQVQDPGNAGTIIRTAEAAGAHGVVASIGTTNPFAPKALRASMGSAFRLPIVTGVQLREVIEIAQRNSAKLVAACAEAKTRYTEHDWKGPSVVFVGNEGGGLTRELRNQCDATVRIPIAPTVESLNVATATAVILFEAIRQRQNQ